MSLLDTQTAIGAVSDLLSTSMSARLSNLNVTIGRPELAANSDGRKLNLFLYRIGFDAHLRNEPLDRGQDPPLWMVLHYLITAFDGDKESDSIAAHGLLGSGLSVLQQMSLLRPSAPALARSPEPLRITFDDADVELLSKVMQGSDEKYRVSAAFQVRPVMIVPEVRGSYAPLVKTVGPPVVPATVPPVGQGVKVLPSLGPRLDSLAPERIGTLGTLTLRGLDLAAVDHVQFGAASLPAKVLPTGEVTADLTAWPPPPLSAGAYPVTVSRALDSTHAITSNALLAHLLPIPTAATKGALTKMPGTDPRLYGKLTLTGDRLGGTDDSIFVAFYRNGALVLMAEPEVTTPQSELTVTVTSDQPLDPGDYLIILRVNGEQADDAQLVSWT